MNPSWLCCAGGELPRTAVPWAQAVSAQLGAGAEVPVSSCNTGAAAAAPLVQGFLGTNRAPPLDALGFNFYTFQILYC